MPHLDIVHLVQAVGYPGVTVMVFLESGIPIGFLFPGASMLFTAGLLSAKGFFDPYLLAALVTAAAILGDSAGYWLGSTLGVRLFLRPDSFFFRRSHLERAKEFYDAYGRQAVFLARFVPLVRTFSPIVAGIVRMPYSLFLFYNVIGAIVWGAGVTFAGYFLGNIPFVQRYFSAVLAAIVITTLLPIAWQLGKPYLLRLMRRDAA